MAKQKVPVTLRATIARINRKLAAEEEELRAARSEAARKKIGNYFVVDCMGAIVHMDVEPEAFARKIGALKEYEEVVG